VTFKKHEDKKLIKKNSQTTLADTKNVTMATSNDKKFTLLKWSEIGRLPMTL
jgi:hypothetical protein